MKLISTIFLVVSLAASGQSMIVSGTVTDDAGDGLPGVNVLEKGTTNGTITDLNGKYSLEVSGPKAVLVFSSVGMATEEVSVDSQNLVDVKLSADVTQLSEVVTLGYGNALRGKIRGLVGGTHIFRNRKNKSAPPAPIADVPNESYVGQEENGFKNPFSDPLSTFSIDVDVASYGNLRRFITNGELPPPDAVRIEEMINYFGYDYKQPSGDQPFSINTEIMDSPWNAGHKFVQIGLQGKNLQVETTPPSNLVFLIDVSGSMSDHNKLPLLQKSLKMLVNNLRDEDRVSIVTYANGIQVRLNSVSGKNKEKILVEISRLQAGGGTSGSDGLMRAYELAKKNFIKSGNNRIILATDGDFNIGPSSDQEMEDLIEEKRKSGVYLTVLGFGMGNYKDSKMEILADKGNGNYAYIDDLFEAKKVLVDEMGAFFTIAEDVKIQVEFNPAKVQAYRLIGYENRMLENEDFDDDAKDAGEIGAGHSVTALYEIVPVGVESKWAKKIGKLKYQRVAEAASDSEELLAVQFRYKEPGEKKSKLRTGNVLTESAILSDNIQWAAAVAGFGMILRNSEYAEELDFEKILELARNSRGKDEGGYRAQFIQLVELAQGLSL